MKLTVAQREQPMQSLLTRMVRGDSMHDLPRFDVDLALGLVGTDFKDAGITAEALDLYDVHQGDVPQSAGKSFALFPADRITQYIEHKAQSVAGDWFFEEKFCASAKAWGAVGFTLRTR